MRGRRSTKTPLLAGDGPLSRVPPLVAFVVVIGLFAAGVIIKGVLGAALLGVLALGLLGLLAGTWHTLAPAQRVARVLVLGVLVVVIITALRA